MVVWFDKSKPWKKDYGSLCVLCSLSSSISTLLLLFTFLVLHPRISTRFHSFIFFIQCNWITFNIVIFENWDLLRFSYVLFYLHALLELVFANQKNIYMSCWWMTGRSIEGESEQTIFYKNTTSLLLLFSALLSSRSHCRQCWESRGSSSRWPYRELPLHGSRTSFLSSCHLVIVYV